MTYIVRCICGMEVAVLDTELTHCSCGTTLSIRPGTFGCVFANAETERKLDKSWVKFNRPKIVSVDGRRVR
jgi:hypothetical protein